MVLKVMEAERQYSSKPYKYLMTGSTLSTQQGLMGNESSQKYIETFDILKPFNCLQVQTTASLINTKHQCQSSVMVLPVPDKLTLIQRDQL